jgi:hypothetical protein
MPHDWRDTLRLAGDLAFLGLVVAVLSLPLCTAGAAVAAGSHAIHHLITEGRWPSFADCRAAFRRRLVSGLWAGPAVVAGVIAIHLDVEALRRGVVPGGGPVLTVTLLAAVAIAGYAAMVAVQAGVAGSGAPRATLSAALAHPLAPVAAAGVLAVAIVLAIFIHPVLLPVLAAYALFALHVVVPRLTRRDRPEKSDISQSAAT